MKLAIFIHRMTTHRPRDLDSWMLSCCLALYQKMRWSWDRFLLHKNAVGDKCMNKELNHVGETIIIKSPTWEWLIPPFYWFGGWFILFYLHGAEAYQEWALTCWSRGWKISFQWKWASGSQLLAVKQMVTPFTKTSRFHRCRLPIAPCLRRCCHWWGSRWYLGTAAHRSAEILELMAIFMRDDLSWFDLQRCGIM